MGINVENYSNDQAHKIQSLAIAPTKEQKPPLKKGKVL